jgi:hypothetical protein
MLRIWLTPSATVELIVKFQRPHGLRLADSQAHEFIFTTYYHTCSRKRVTWVLFCFALGAGLMSLLGECLACTTLTTPGKWA